MKKIMLYIAISVVWMGCSSSPSGPEDGCRLLNGARVDASKVVGHVICDGELVLITR